MPTREYIRGNVELVQLVTPKGALPPKALPYPPGVLCVVPGEVWWCGAALLALEEGINMLPGLSPQLQAFTARK
ncbi:hypothetical protein ACNKHO_18490 [Shigella flexneri]